MFPVRYGLNIYILARKRSVFKGLKFIYRISVSVCKRVHYANVSSIETRPNTT
jgi:hypothetical protein